MANDPTERLIQETLARCIPNEEDRRAALARERVRELLERPDVIAAQGRLSEAPPGQIEAAFRLAEARGTFTVPAGWVAVGSLSWSADEIRPAASGGPSWSRPRDIGEETAHALGALRSTLAVVITEATIVVTVRVGGWTVDPPPQIAATVSGGANAVDVPLSPRSDNSRILEGETPWPAGPAALTVDLYRY